MNFVRAHNRRLLTGASIAGGVLFVCIAGSIMVPLPKEDFRKEHLQSLRIYDRQGTLLRKCLHDGREYADWKPLSEISPFAVQATIAVEDRRFLFHHGIDPVAIARALAGNLRAFAFRAGGSTLTQQVIRNVYHPQRTLRNKVAEMWYALRLEQMMTKQEILEQYLNRVSYGNRLIGIEAASRSYFDRPARDLSLAQAAFLAGLPNAPTALNPWRTPAPALARQHAILLRMLNQKWIDRDAYDRACREPLQILPEENTMKAGHVIDMVLREVGADSSLAAVHLTIDYALQRDVQAIMRTHIASLVSRNVTNAAVVIIDNASMEIRTLAGSLNYFDERHGGQVNGALALRQPGSAIKPLMYTLALERGFTPADLLADIPTDFADHGGEYVPENYDRMFHGPVRLRTALACSYNVPAVRVVHSIGVPAFLDVLHEAGLSSLTESAEYYGYGLTLGNGDVTLLELTTAYAALAHGGTWQAARLIRARQGLGDSMAVKEELPLRSATRRVYAEQAAFMITDILSDPSARRPAFGSWFRFPFPCAVKTGTTKDYRDNWTLGYTTRYTVGVWVGNFDGTPMHGVSGVSGAGPIFMDIMNLLHNTPTSTPPLPFVIPNGVEERTICVVSGQAPGDHCRQTMREWFLSDAPPLPPCTVHRAFRVRDANGKYTTRVYQFFPPEYAEWAANAHLPSPPADAFPIGSKRLDPMPARKGKPLAILSPSDGDCYKIDPILRREYQAISITASIPDGVRDPLLNVDDTLAIPCDGRGARWTLERGTHTLQCSGTVNGQRVVGEPISIHVE